MKDKSGSSHYKKTSIVLSFADQKDQYNMFWKIIMTLNLFTIHRFKSNFLPLVV